MARIKRTDEDALLPKHDEFSLFRRAFSATAIAAATVLLAWNIYRVAGAGGFLDWWLVVVAVMGVVAADFLSGIVHWTADTWGSASMPLIGRRLLHPFRRGKGVRNRFDHCRVETVPFLLSSPR
jgi:hypothetical protein